MRRGEKSKAVMIYGAILVVLAVALYFVYDYWRDHRFDEPIAVMAQKHGLSPYLVKAVIWRESRFNPTARGPVDEIGLMQVRPSTAMEWAKVHHVPEFNPVALYQPEVNIDIGCWYLRRGCDRWVKNASDPVPFALAEYNAGRGNVLRWVSSLSAYDQAHFLPSITYPKTREYVVTILERRDRYARRGHL